MVWDTFFEKIEKFLTEIKFKKSASKYISISLDVYQKFHDQNRRLSSEKEEQFCFLLEKTYTELYDFFQSINALLFNDYKLTYSNNKEKIIEKLETRTIPITELKMERFIPFFDYEIEEYDDKNVLETLSYMATLVGTFLFLVDFDLIKEKLKYKNILIEKNKKQIEKIMKMSFFIGITDNNEHMI